MTGSAPDGFDRRQYRRLVRLFWWLDVRSKQGRTTGGFTSRLLLNGLAYAITGSWTLHSVLNATLQPTAQALVLFAFTMLLVAFALVSGYEALLGPAATVDLTSSWPVSPITFTSAKATILAVHTGLVAVPLSLPAAIWLATHGRPGAAAIYLVISLSASLTAASVALLVTFALIRRVTPGWFRRVLVYAQAAVVLGLLVVYQGLQLARAGGWLDRAGDLEVLVLTPPGWFAALWAWATGGPSSAGAAGLAVAATLVTPALLAMQLGRRLPDLLERLRQSDRTGGPGRMAARRDRWLPDADLRAGFSLVEAHLRGDRSLRTRLAPLVAMPLAVVLFGLMTGRLGDPVAVGSLIERPSTALNLSLLMVALLTAFVVGIGVRVSSVAGASWVYQTAPLERPGLFLLGTRLALIARVWLPLYLLIAVAWSLAVPDGHGFGQTIGLALATELVVAGWSAVQPRWPLSEPEDRVELTGRFLRAMVVLPIYLALIVAQEIGLRQQGGTFGVQVGLAVLVLTVEWYAVRRADRQLRRVPRVQPS